MELCDNCENGEQCYECILLSMTDEEYKEHNKMIDEALAKQ